ncbi:MAG: extracellular solute-binding protein [Fibrobacter sp.]|nr:extracellular solute-binding protein [Fibrobacter sp.]
MRLKFILILLLAPAMLMAKPLEVWIMPNGANPQGILEERLVQFTKETGLSAKVVVLDWGEAWSRISEALESGQGPDVLQLGTTWVSFFASKGWLSPLDAHLGKVDPGRFVPVSWKTTQVDDQNSIYAIPWFMDVRVLMANKALLAESGLDNENIVTLDSFRLALDRFKSLNKTKETGTIIYPFAFPGKSDWNIPHNFAPWIWSQGGDFIVKENGQWQSNLLNPKTIKGIKLYVNFILDSLVNVSTLKENTAQVTSRFNNGEQLFSINTSEVIMQTRVDESKGGTLNSRIGQDGISTFPIPSGPAGSVAFIGGSNLALPKAKQNNSRALQLLLFLTRGDNLDIYTQKIGFLPPDTTVLSEWAQDSLYKVLVDQAKEGKAYPNIPNWGEIESMLVEMFSAVWSLLDVGGLYSDEELYEILSRYHLVLNKSLDAGEVAVLSKDEFYDVIKSIKSLEELKYGPKKEKSSARVDLLQKVEFRIALAVLFILLLSLIGVIRLRKKQN